jgi:hypothetical protein
VESTAINNDFLILCASTPIAGEKDVMSYFVPRNETERKDQIEQNLMELAFFKSRRSVQ